MTGEALKAAVKERALSLGFSDCRIAPCGRATHANEFHQWLENGFHGDMEWLNRNPTRRADPREVLPGVQAMVVVALNYFQGDEPANVRELPGQIARYALGDDYHDLMEVRLKELSDFLSELGGTQRFYVDHGPILERDFATDSGLGWNGKSTVQIHRELGTWFFLGEVLTTLEIPPDPAITNHCGKCTQCIDCCPTKAIIAPHKVEATKCISYLTIEHKGAIPEELRPQIGDRIYGCDDCLDVCPWNRFAQEAHDLEAFSVRPDVRTMSLIDFLGLDDDQFRTLFRKSPIKRIKRPRFLRNVCVALGNVGTAAALPELQRLKTDEDPLISEHAQWAIDNIQERESSGTS